MDEYYIWHRVAKFRKLVGKVSLTGKIYTSSKKETTSTRWHYHFQITNHVITAYLSRVSMQKKKILPSYFRMFTRPLDPESR